ncbi:hypothetical protein CCACVL1_19284 [Corchorus capsularis]|uniref:Uncharacterized protein n=1 Tax=Corchorus capsularis TaxID=210143 RepID=A0A1R3HHJ4_COCAP|nr:hypothetical protein CCACVL1_19284 [Corchorus capsularis]
MEHEEQEACLMFHNSYPCAYYVQSPSTLSHADSATAGNNSPIKNADADVSRFTLSRYSSSRGSNNSFLHLQQHDKKINHVDADPMAAVNRLIIIDQYPVVDHDDDDDYEYQQAGGGWWWSFSIALLVFYIATKPPPPQFSIKMARVGEFGLGEGVDASGVTTKILTCNCSIHLLIDNKSKLFGLHIHPPILDISFQRLPPFAISRVNN